MKSINKVWILCEVCQAPILVKRRYSGSRRFCSNKCRASTPEFKKRNSEILKALNQDPEFKKRNSERMSKRMKALHQDPEFKKRNSERISKTMKALHQDPEFKKRNSERMSKRMEALNQDPEFRKRNSERMSKRMKALHQDPEFKKHHSERSSKRLKALHQDPEFKKRNIERMKALHQDREFRKRNSERSSKRLKALHQDPEFKKRNIERMKAGKTRSKWLRVVLYALRYPLQWRNYIIDLTPVRDRFENCEKCVRVGIAHPATKTACEIDVWSQDSSGNYERNRIRDAALTLLGWEVIRISKEEAEEDIDDVINRVRSVILRRSNSQLPQSETSCNS